MTRDEWSKRSGRSSKWIRKSTRYAIYARDLFACVYCGDAERLTLDHVKPQCDGGSNDPSNLVTACYSCNSAKQGGKLPAGSNARVRRAVSRRVDREIGRRVSALVSAALGAERIPQPTATRSRSAE